MANFLDIFPRITYDINKDRYENLDVVTNIFFRVGIVKSILDNYGSYFVYEIPDGQRPEVLAERIYGNPDAYWIIMYANDMYDPMYDWPLSYDAFKKFIINRYGSIATAKTTYHHYEKVIERQESFTGIITTQYITINKEKATTNTAASLADVPYDYYDDPNLPTEGAWITINMGNGKSVQERVYKRRITNYDYEDELNNNKRFVKVIKAEYYNTIIEELKRLVDPTKTAVSFRRRLI